VYSIQRAIKLNKSPAFLFTDIAQLKAESVKASDRAPCRQPAKTASTQGFLSILTFTIGGIVDSKEVKTKESGGDFGSGYLLDHSSGSGPFVIDHWTKSTEVLLKANPNYGGRSRLSPRSWPSTFPSRRTSSSHWRRATRTSEEPEPPADQGATGKAGVTTASGNSLQLVYVGMNSTFKRSTTSMSARPCERPSTTTAS